MGQGPKLVGPCEEFKSTHWADAWRRLQRHREGISLKGRGNRRETFRYFWLIWIFVTYIFPKFMMGLR